MKAQQLFLILNLFIVLVTSTTTSSEAGIISDDLLNDNSSTITNVTIELPATTSAPKPLPQKREEPEKSVFRCKNMTNQLVDCKTACVAKSSVDETNYEFDHQKYGVQIMRRGCEGHSNFNLKSVECKYETNNGLPYSILYSIANYEKNRFLTVRKYCCWTVGCNAKNDFRNPRYVFVPRSNVKKAIDSLQVDSFFYFVITAVVLLFLAIFAAQKYYVYATSRIQVKRTDYYNEAEQNLKELNEFKEESMIDTRVKVTGCMTIKDLSKVLALFPDESRNSKLSKTHSDDVYAYAGNDMLKGAKCSTHRCSIEVERPLLAHCIGFGHEIMNTDRVILTPKDLLYRMVEHGPYQFPFDIIELLQLFEETAYILGTEPSLLKLEGGITIVGDLRGRYIDLHRWLQLTGWPPNNKLLFLGGMIDVEQKGSLETLALICALKCRFPHHIYMLRGVPEASEFTISNRYDPMICRSIQSSVARMLSYLPYSAVIGQSILATYSGFSPLVRSKQDLLAIQRPVRLDSIGKIEKHIMFNQPSPTVKMYRPNPLSEGDHFGKHAILRACKLYNVRTVVRAHTVVPNGYMPIWHHRLLNIWSAPALGGAQGAVLCVSRDMSITPVILRARKY